MLTKDTKTASTLVISWKKPDFYTNPRQYTHLESEKQGMLITIIDRIEEAHPTKVLKAIQKNPKTHLYLKLSEKGIQITHPAGSTYLHSAVIVLQYYKLLNSFQPESNANTLNKINGVIQTLLEKKADKTIKDANGMTAYEIAGIFKDDETMRLLRQ